MSLGQKWQATVGRLTYVEYVDIGRGMTYRRSMHLSVPLILNQGLFYYFELSAPWGVVKSNIYFASSWLNFCPIYKFKFDI